MFKIESYITPYILAYFNKYFSNFNPGNFQVSLWSGAASFYDLDLNLEVLEEELGWPVKLLSGHIHQLQVCVPWTKITYEPILAYVNTIEITMRLKKPLEFQDSESPSSAAKNAVPKYNEEAPGYVQSLVNKVIMNLRIECQNVIVKIVEEDVVFTLNVKNATLSPTDENWIDAFIDLIANGHIFRRQVTLSDLTICLDKMNTSGKIEHYLEPLLYKCFLQVRIYQQYSSRPGGGIPHTVMDVLCGALRFTVTDEQIPMLTRLYNEVLRTNACHRQYKLMLADRQREDSQTFKTSDGQQPYKDEYGESWGSWGMGIVTSAAAAFVGIDPEEAESEDQLMDDYENLAVPVIKLGVYADKTEIDVKGMETLLDEKVHRGLPRLTFQSFLKVSLQGMVLEVIQKGSGFNVFTGVSNMVVEGLNSCPCGIRDCIDECSAAITNQYFSVGNNNPAFASQSLFENVEIKLPEHALFSNSNRSEHFSEESMLQKTPGIAIEYLDTGQEWHLSSTPNDSVVSEPGKPATEVPAISFNQTLCRIVVAPCMLELSSGSLHRLQMVQFAINAYEIGDIESDPSDTSPILLSSANNLAVAELPEDIYQLTIIRPSVRIIASDHPDFNERTHIIARKKKRKAVTTSPLSQIFSEWPNLSVNCDCLDSKSTFPSASIVRVLRHHGLLSTATEDNIIRQKRLSKFMGLHVGLNSADSVIPLLRPCNLDLTLINTITPNQALVNAPQFSATLRSDDLLLNFTRPQMITAQVILNSFTDYRVAHYFTSSSLLKDLYAKDAEKVKLHVTSSIYDAVFTGATHSARIIVGSFEVSIGGDSLCEAVPVIVNLPNSDRSDSERSSFLTATVQFSYNHIDKASSELVIPLLSLSISEFRVNCSRQLLNWLSYAPMSEPSRIPSALQAQSREIHPMIPVTRTSSRMSIFSRAQSASEYTGSVTGKDIKRLYEDDVSEDSSSVISSSVAIARKQPTSTSTTSTQFVLQYSLNDFYYIWNHAAFNSYQILLIIDMKAGSVHVADDPNSRSEIVICTPEFEVKPESVTADLMTSIHNSSLPLTEDSFPKTLYPIRIKIENFGVSTLELELVKPIMEPLSVVLTLTVAQKPSVDNKDVLQSMFVHTDIPNLRVAVDFNQIRQILQMQSTLSSVLNTYQVTAQKLKSLDLQSKGGSGGSIISEEPETLSRRRIDQSTLGSSILLHQSASQYLLEEPEESSPELNSLSNITAITVPPKIAVWFQFAIANFQAVLIYVPNPSDILVHQILLDVEDIVASLDVQEVFQKLSLKVGSCSLKTFELPSHVIHRWTPGKCTSIIFTSGDEIAREFIHLKGPKKPEVEFEHSASGESSPVDSSYPQPQPAYTTSGTTARNCLILTFTRVQCKNFHTKSDLQSPVTKWNTLLGRYCSRYEIPPYDQFQEEDLRFLSELDVKCGRYDLMLDFERLQPYMDQLLKAFISPDVTPVSPEVANNSWSWSNINTPLVYLQTGHMRLFLKGRLNRGTSSLVHDTIVLETSRLQVDSQSENPLERTIVDRYLHRLAEQALILDVPGAPVEDRQYQIDLKRVVVFTLSWEFLMLNSKELAPSRKNILKTMEENPAYVWNTMTASEAVPRALACTILDQVDMGISVAPSIVYAPKITNTKSFVLVAGSSLELHVKQEANIYMSLLQGECFKRIYEQMTIIISCTGSSSSEEIGREAAGRSNSDSGIASSVQHRKISGSLDSASVSRLAAPLDVLASGFLLQIVLYSIPEPPEVYEVSKSKVDVAPLLLLVIGQPHAVVTLNGSNSKTQLSMFDVSIGVCSQLKQSSGRHCLPGFQDFAERLFDTKYGERSSKTGMVNAFISVKCTDVLTPTGSLLVEVSRPTEVILSRKLLLTCLKVYEHLTAFLLISKTVKSSATEISFSTDSLHSKMVASWSHLATNLKLKIDQIVLKIVEEGSREDTSCTTTFALQGAEIEARIKKKMPASFYYDDLWTNLKLTGVSLATGIGTRRDLLLVPFITEMTCKFRWSSIHFPPNIVANGKTGCIGLRLGPQNLLAIVQLQKIIETFLEDFSKSNSLESLLHEGPLDGTTAPEEFEDDLRSGNFLYVYADKVSDTPGIYQIMFNELDKTMTWRYPHKRCLTRLETLPVPLDSVHFTRESSTNEIECVVEYFDDVQQSFCSFGTFYLSETSKGSLQVPHSDSYHLYTSNVWRITINAPDSGIAVKPDILAASLRVDSIQDDLLNPRLKISLEVPKLQLSLLNHLTFAGRGKRIDNSFYALGGPNLSDHPFFVLSLDHMNLLSSIWVSKLEVDISTEYAGRVTDFSYLTDSSVIEPSRLEASYAFKENTRESTVESKLQIFSKPVEIKLSSNIMHSLTVSLQSWLQVLGTYDGTQMNLTDLKNKNQLILTEWIICNDLNSDILINQVRKAQQDSPVLNIPCESVGCREYYSFVWPSNKALGKCKISVRSPDWKISDYISFTGVGYQVVDIPKTKHKLFVSAKKVSSTHKKITVFGSFAIANACKVAIEIALLPGGGGRELTWAIQPGTHGPSTLTNIDDIEHLRFRFLREENIVPWSTVFLISDLKRKTQLCVPLYLQDDRQHLSTVSVWCTLLHEEIKGHSRYMVMLSPAFRIKSSLSAPTHVASSVGKIVWDEQFELGGRGAELEIEYSGNLLDTPRHLSFHKSESTSPLASPVLLDPLKTPESAGPVPSIDCILDMVYENLADSKARSRPAEQWPYITERIDPSGWLPCTQPETDIQLGFTTWVPGLPTILVELKPWALFVNLLGQPLYYKDDVSGDRVFELSAPGTFTPTRAGAKFSLGFESRGDLYWSRALEVSEEFSRQEIHEVNSNGNIPLDGCSFLEIDGVKEVSFMTIETRMKKGIIIVAIRPTFVVRNEVTTGIKVKGISLRLKRVQKPTDWNIIEDFTTLAPATKIMDLTDSNATFTPLTLHLTDISKQDAADSASYLAISNGGPWWFVQLFKFDRTFNYLSCPEGISGRRIATVLPGASPLNDSMNSNIASLSSSSNPVVLSWTAKNGQIWINISGDDHPQVVVHNLSDYSLFCAQASDIVRIPVPDTENFDQYDFIPKGTVGHFAFPGHYAEFPAVDKAGSCDTSLLSLMFAGVPDEPMPIPRNIKDSLGFFSKSHMLYSGVFEWSKPVRISGQQGVTQIINTLGIKATIENIGFTTVIYIENLSTVEILAKDIRHRIKSMSLDKVDNTHKEMKPEPEKIMHTSKNIEVPKLAVGIMAKPLVVSPVEAMIYFPIVRIVLLTEANEEGFQFEALSLNVQDFLIQRYLIDTHARLRCLSGSKLNAAMTRIHFGDVQLDTAPFNGKKSEFNVILRQDADYNPLFTIFENFDLYAPMPLDLPTQPVLVAEFISEHISLNDFSVSHIDLKSLPWSANMDKHFIEDVLPVVDQIVSVLEERSSCFTCLMRLPIMCSAATGKLQSESGSKSAIDENDGLSANCSPNQFPSKAACSLQCSWEIQNILRDYATPLRLKTISVASVKVYVSVRIKYGMYLAFDRAPMDLQPFKRSNVVTTYYQLGNVVGQHYWQNVLFGYKNLLSGVGSWEGVGSPTRFVGEVSSGLRDLVVLPYEGMFQGPSGFFVGIGRGCTSMVKHIAAGTLNSVTSGAWTWSRNLDALTQDDEDKRTEIHGISDGVTQGFTSLGVRMLGAVAGIAHYPIQAVISDGASTSGIVSGVAKGVASVVTKPVSGALEFLAMTGEGILKGTGWTQTSKVKYEPSSDNISQLNYSSLKYQLKLIPEELEDTIFLIVHATQKSKEGSSEDAAVPVALILSDQNLYIHQSDTDTVMVQLPLRDVKIAVVKEDLISIKINTTVGIDRVMDYVMGISDVEAHRLIDEPSFATEPNTSSRLLSAANDSSLVPHSHFIQPDVETIGSYYIDPSSRELFISVFDWLQKTSTGVIFRVI